MTASQLYYRRHRQECLERRCQWNRLHRERCNELRRKHRVERLLWAALDEMRRIIGSPAAGFQDTERI